MSKKTASSQLFTLQKKIWAVIISIILLCSNYTICNTSFPLPNEMVVLRNMDIINELCGWKEDSIPDNIMLINVSYDKELVDFVKQKEDTVGKTPIIDRHKLFEFLKNAKEANTYKYIFLDVNFEKGYISKSDSALFNLIAEMDRIVIPRHEGKYLQDDRLYSKAANSDYTVTKEETNFVRFQFIHDSIKSIPLKMYNDINKKDIHKWGPFYFSGNWLCRNGITLKLPFTTKMFIPNLGKDILENGNNEDFNGKIVIIGDFENDMHDTYKGKQPGAIIIMNAYYALVQGDHILFGKYGLTLLFYVFIALLYFFLAILYLNGKSLSSLFENAWIKVFVSIVSINILFWIIAGFAYFLGVVYNLWIPTVVFSILDFIVNTYKNYRDEKNNKCNAVAVSANSDCECSGSKE